MKHQKTCPVHEDPIAHMLKGAPSRRNIDNTADRIGDSAEKFDRLMQLVFHGNPDIAPRAAWAMDACLSRHPEWIQPYLCGMIDRLPHITTDGTKRQIVKNLSTTAIPESHEGKIVDCCFRWLQSPKTPVAVKVHCMQILANITARHPELAGELRHLIEEQMPHSSAAFRSRGRKLLAVLSQQKTSRSKNISNSSE
ncbi:MAG: hypothetical protein LBS03_02570 [Bacteroidales bacterium]|jgi:hypothetical protein|nr:hypothetical protein [Bacteroidales bacterium]